VNAPHVLESVAPPLKITYSSVPAVNPGKNVVSLVDET